MFLARAPFLKQVYVIVVTALAILLAGVVSNPHASHAGKRSRYTFKKVEKCMLGKINKRRVKNGVAKLSWDRQLGYVARKHAKRMARQGTIFHDDGLGYRVTRWRALGQNVGEGGGCKKLFRAFWDSAPHRHNILGRWSYVGVGSDRRNGRIFVQQVFEHKMNPGNVYTYP